MSSLPSAQPDTLEEQGAFAAGRAEAVIATPVPGEEMAEPTGSGTWVAGRIALVAATVVALALVVVGIGKAAFWSAQGGAATTSATPSVTARPSASPSVTPTAATATPTPPPTASAKTTAPRTSAPSTSPFFTPELKAFGAGWQSGLRCTSHHDSPARAIDATSCSLSPSAIPDVTKNASRSVTVFLEQFLPGAADDYLGCTPTYTIPGMVGKVDNPGTSGNRAGFYCETTGNLSDNGSLVGMCTYIMWTSGDVRMLGMVYQCFRFSDEGANFKPTPAMLSYLRSLWNARA